MFRYETHMHTMEASACSNSSAADMADKYKAEGYTGVFVTDHFFNGNTSVPRELPWREWVEGYCKGYEHAKARGDEIGLDVFFGFEFGDGGSDFLIYGLDKQWLIENPEILTRELTQTLEYIRSCGGFVVHAHPFRDYEYIRRTIHCPHFTDAVEIINASHTYAEFNDRARLYAEWYDLPVTAGSDAHNTTDRWYGGGIETDMRITSPSDYMKVIREGRITGLLDRPDRR
ncbi:MAG: PHP-associated domain-containing protein [Huintestinicola sp.]